MVARDENGVWLTPGGTRQPGESLTRCLRREIREETAIRVEPIRPYAATEQVYTCADPDVTERLSFTVGTHAARPETTELGDLDELPDPSELPAADEEIEAVAWVAELPDQTFRRETGAYVLSASDLW